MATCLHKDGLRFGAAGRLIKTKVSISSRSPTVRLLGCRYSSSPPASLMGSFALALAHSRPNGVHVHARSYFETIMLGPRNVSTTSEGSHTINRELQSPTSDYTDATYGPIHTPHQPGEPRKTRTAASQQA